MTKDINKKSIFGFTIVELLVVIVVIGVLVAISIASYSNISRLAIEVSIQSDFSNAVKQLKLSLAEYDAYPTSMNCAQSESSSNKCLKPSAGNTFTSLQSSSNESFCLELTNNTLNSSFYITNSLSAPVSGNCPTAPRISAGVVTCALSSDDNVYCWGQNTYGGAGNNTSGNSILVPTAVNKTTALNGLTVKSMAVSATGSGHTCVIASDDNAYCWGYNNGGQIGNGTVNTNYLTPVAVDKTGSLVGLTIKSIATGSSHTCVIASDDNAYCWGRNNNGQLGNNDGSRLNKLSPDPVYRGGALSGLTIKSITAGADHTCVIASDNNVYCWGYNGYGQIGNNTSSNTYVVPVATSMGPLGGKAKLIATGNYHTCMTDIDNKPYCWGYGLQGQIGRGSTSDSLTITDVDISGVLSGMAINKISAGGNTTCVVASDNKAYCWGHNNFYQVGDGSGGANALSPKAVYADGVLNSLLIKDVVVGGNYSCAMASGYYCWGFGGGGNMGNGLLDSYNQYPIEVNPFP